MCIYYVYAYMRKISSSTATAGTPYYIGKGKGNRAWNKHATRIPVPSDHSYIIICESNLTELVAFALERRLIRWYGRKDIGTGILLNKTDGGDGTANLSEETRKKIGMAHKGKKISAEAIQKKSISSKGIPPWNKGLKGVQTPWNKGLTKSDPRVANNISNLSKSNIGREPWNKGVKGISDETRIKMSNAAKNRPPMSEETRQKLSESTKKARAIQRKS